VNGVGVLLLPVEQGEEQVDPEPGGVRVRKGVATTGVEVGRNHHDVEDVLDHHESVGWTRKQGQAGNADAGHADDGHVAQHLEDMNEDAKKSNGIHFFLMKNILVEV